VAEIPEHILRRSAEARARAEGRSVEEVLAELRGGAPAAPAAPAEPAPPAAEVEAAPPADADVEEPAADIEEPAADIEEPAAAAAAPAAAAGDVIDLQAESKKFGVPASLLQRALIARARKDGDPLPHFAGQAAPAPAAAAPAAAAGAGGAAPTVAAVPEGVRTQRLLTVVKAGAIQQVKSEPTDKVSTWPHLVAMEFVALMVVTAFLLVFSAFVNAPLLEFANFNEQPNPSKAPWYFLGLQELLSYFDPQVAGVIIPGFGLGALALVPFIDRNPSVRPSDRKLAIMIFTFYVMAAGILTIFGSFFRGPGFNFVFPWIDGLFFDF
jgi:menaquinol-cytochrome c reductase cytochrome b/c subunit